jgi:hypothetical protein
MKVIRKLVILSNKQAEESKGVVAFENVAGKIVCTATTQGTVADCTLYIRNGEEFLEPKRAEQPNLSFDLGDIQLANEIECILHNGDKTVMRGAFPGKGRGCGDVIAGCLEKFGSEEIGLGASIIIEEIEQKTEVSDMFHVEQAGTDMIIENESIEIPPPPETDIGVQVEWGVDGQEEPEAPELSEASEEPYNELAQSHYLYARTEEVTEEVAADEVAIDAAETLEATEVVPEATTEAVAEVVQEADVVTEAAQEPVPYQNFVAEGGQIYNSDRPFYDAVSAQLLELFATHPKATGLVRAVENSQFCKIKHGRGYYVVGLITKGEKPRYICYGTPARADEYKAQTGCSEFINTCKKNPQKGYHLTFQDAITGETVVNG